ncbi:MAG: L-aspartate oxidase [bacterium JZ-2024 1]
MRKRFWDNEEGGIMEIYKAEVVIVGAGIAGTSAALGALDEGRKVLILSKQVGGAGGSTRFAQGGIAYKGEGDSEDLLIEDIKRVGGEYVIPERVEILVREGIRAIEDILIRRLNVPFDTLPDGRYELGLESGHSRRRILHRGDETGSVLEQKMVEYLRRKEGVSLWKNAYVYDLIVDGETCMGCRVLYEGKDVSLLAGKVILATGGIGDIYLYSTNPKGSSGDGIALAARYGVPIRNAHFVQFHPTVFFGPTGIPLLLTEAIRGEGAYLENAYGEAFMEKYAPDQRDLAPRRVVARAVFEEIRRTGKVFLNIKPVKKRLLLNLRFPFVSEMLRREGIFIEQEDRIPVTVAQHFFCGGIETDEWGRTSLKNLYAVGECAWTGVHGWDRLASTSLLEGLVWGLRAGKDAAISFSDIPEAQPEECLCSLDRPLPPGFTREKMMRLKKMMWEYAGIDPVPDFLPAVHTEILRLRGEAEDYCRFRLDQELFEFRSSCWVASAIASALISEKEKPSSPFFSRL